MQWKWLWKFRKMSLNVKMIYLSLCCESIGLVVEVLLLINLGFKTSLFDLDA